MKGLKDALQAEATTKTSDDYKHADQNYQQAYDSALEEATTLADKQKGSNKSKHDVETLTQKLQAAKKALNGEVKQKEALQKAKASAKEAVTTQAKAKIEKVLGHAVSSEMLRTRSTCSVRSVDTEAQMIALMTEEKQATVQVIKAELHKALEAIEQATDPQKVQEAQTQALQSLQSVKLTATEKPKAMKALQDQANQAKAKVQSDQALSPEEKKQVLEKIDKSLTEGLDKIKGAKKSAEVQNQVTSAKKQLQEASLFIKKGHVLTPAKKEVAPTTTPDQKEQDAAPLAPPFKKKAEASSQAESNVAPLVPSYQKETGAAPLTPSFKKTAKKSEGQKPSASHKMTKTEKRSSEATQGQRVGAQLPKTGVQTVSLLGLAASLFSVGTFFFFKKKK